MMPPGGAEGGALSSGDRPTIRPIVLLASSRRRGNTGALADAIAGQLRVEVVDLSALRLSAYDYEHCNRDDDFEPLMARVLECDPIIFASPIYWYTCAPSMKVFLDRISDYLELPELLEQGRRLRGKDAYVACTSVRDEASDHFLGAFQDTFAYLGMRFRGVVHINCIGGYRASEHDAVAQGFVETLKTKAI
jgi:multimeric flavodoxin WrbA